MARLALVGLFLSLPLLAADPEINRAPWYKPPQLFVMTGFIANSTTGVWGADFLFEGEWTPERQQAALAKWNKGLGRSYDADRTIRLFKEAGASGVIFYDKWHDGLVNHDTKLTGFKTKRDLVRPTVDALRKHGMKTVIYYSVGLDYNPEPKFQDWACRDSDGKPLGMAFTSDWLSFHSPYRRYVIEHLIELAKHYGPVEGFWLDLYTQPSPLYRITRMRGPEFSHDRYTLKAFEEKYKKPASKATDAELENFIVESMRDFLLDIRRDVSAAQPGVSFTWNGAGMDDIARPKRARRIAAPADFFSMEGHSIPGIDRGARAGHAMDRPFEVGMLLNSSWYVPMEDKAPPAAMSEEEAIVSAATAWIQGSNVYAAMTPGHSGVFDENGDLRLLRAVGGWLKNNRDWLSGATPYADAGILMGNPSAEVDRIPTLGELWRRSHRAVMDEAVQSGDRPGQGPDLGLRRAGYFTESVGGAFAARAFDLASYRLLVLPETALVDDSLARQIRDYVRNGGKLLAFGHASLFDQNGVKRGQFALNDVFGADYAGALPGYKQLALAPGSGLTSSLPLNPGAVSVKATTGEVLATWASAGQAPAILENRFGKGHVIYTSAEEIAFGEGSALLEELAARLIGAPPVTLRSTREYTLLINRGGGALVLYLLNRSTGSRTSVGSYVATKEGQGPFAGGEKVRITLDPAILGDIRSVQVIPSARPVELSRRAGSVQIQVEAAPSVTALRLSR
jgi:hypothetical protein